MATTNIIKMPQKINLPKLRERILNCIVPAKELQVKDVFAKYLILLENKNKSLQETQEVFALSQSLNQLGLYVAFSEVGQAIDVPAYLRVLSVDDFLAVYPNFSPVKDQLQDLTLG